MDPMGRIMVQDGAGRAHSQAAREWKAGVLSILLREFQTAYGRDPPWMLLDGDFQQHETVLTLNTNGLLPPGSPLPNPATTCAPQRTTGLAASAAIGLDDELSTLDMAGRSTAINPVPNETGSACTALPMTAVSAANHSLLPPGPPLLCHLVCASEERRTGCGHSAREG